MNFSGTKCDECGRLKGEGNHWLRLGTVKWEDPRIQRVWVELGELWGDTPWPDAAKWEQHDLCGEQCFYKHIGKLLRLNPVEAV